MGGTYDHSLAGRPRPASRPDLDGGARLRRTHLENPRSVSRSGGVADVEERQVFSNSYDLDQDPARAARWSPV